MANLHDAIRALNPAVITIRDDVAYSQDEQVIEYDLEAAQAKIAELQAIEDVAVQAQIDAKQSALNKLKALGLTEEEALALGINL